MMSVSVLPLLRPACSFCSEAGSGVSLFAAAPDPGCCLRCCLPGGPPPPAAPAAAAASAPAWLSAELAALDWRLCALLPACGTTNGTLHPARAAAASGFLSPSAAIRRRRGEDRKVYLVVCGAEMLGHNVLLKSGKVVTCVRADRTGDGQQWCDNRVHPVSIVCDAPMLLHAPAHMSNSILSACKT